MTAPQTDLAAVPLAFALEALPDPVVIVSGTGGLRILFANAAADRLFPSAKPGALVAMALRDPTLLDVVRRAFESRVRATAIHRPSDQRDRAWTARAVPFTPPDAAAPLILLHLHDETDARSTERMRADFLANASHELRTPLASLSGYIETLRGPARDDPDARDRFLGIMAAQAERMRRLVIDLLSLSRIEMNEHVPPDGEVNLASVVQEVVGGTVELARQRDVRLEAEAALEPIVVRGDRGQIVQLVQNLIDNGVKYAPPGSAVTVSLLGGLTAAEASAPAEPEFARWQLLTPERAQGVRYGLVRVRDQGAGIERRNLHRLSERFYRVEGQKSGEKLGTGLGLAIVKHVLNRHRGGLLVESLPGRGSLFCAYLPLAADGEAASAP